MRRLLSLITVVAMFSFAHTTYYNVGQTVNSSDQNIAFDVCYGDYPQDQLKLSHFNGKISVFGLSTTW